MSTPLVSVIIPVYNGAKYLPACLNSILEQHIPDMEILVVDDGSRDGTWSILESYAQKDSRVKPIHQENAGVSAARNAALAVCTGQYVRFVDADDFLPGQSMALLLESMEKHGSDLVVAAYTEVTGTVRAQRCLAREENCLEQEAFLKVFSRQSNSFFYGVLWNKLFRGDIIRRHALRFPAGMHWGEDFHFVTDYLEHVRRVSFVTRPVYEYRRNMSGIVVTHFFDCLRHPFDNLQVRLKMYRNYRQLYRDLGLYPRYRLTLWLFLFRFTIHN